MGRTRLVLLTVAVAVLGVGSPAVAGGADTTIRIAHRAGALYPYDPSFEGGGPTYPATLVQGLVRNCPDGSYWLSATLEQDGLPTEWATTARGAGEVLCEGGTGAAAMPFYREDPVLHPGRARVWFQLHSNTDGSVLAEAAATVRIPG